MSHYHLTQAVHFRKGRSARLELHPGVASIETPPPLGRTPRVARLMALALHVDTLLQRGDLVSQAEVARVGHVTRARISQIMSLLHLAPSIQEDLLFLPTTQRGRDVIQLRHVLPLTKLMNWQEQRLLWQRLLSQ